MVGVERHAVRAIHSTRSAVLATLAARRLGTGPATWPGMDAGLDGYSARTTPERHHRPGADTVASSLAAIASPDRTGRGARATEPASLEPRPRSHHGRAGGSGCPGHALGSRSLAGGMVARSGRATRAGRVANRPGGSGRASGHRCPGVAGSQWPPGLAGAPTQRLGARPQGSVAGALANPGSIPGARSGASAVLAKFEWQSCRGSTDVAGCPGFASDLRCHPGRWHRPAADGVRPIAVACLAGGTAGACASVERRLGLEA